MLTVFFCMHDSDLVENMKVAYRTNWFFPLHSLYFHAKKTIGGWDGPIEGKETKVMPRIRNEEKRIFN